MLACLLCGMVLPAAADGEETAQLYVKVGDDYLTELTIPEGFSKIVTLYTKNEGTNTYSALTAGTPSTTSTAVTLSGDVTACTIQAKTVDQTADITVNDESVTYAPVRVTVTASQLQIKKTTETTWGTSLSGIKAGESVPVKFQLTAGGESVPYTDAITVNPTDGLTYSSDTLTATKAGTYTLSCKYSGSVTVTVVDAAFTAEDLNTSELLNGVLQSKATLEAYLAAKGYPTGGNITLQLPESVQYEKEITIGEGMNGVNLTLQGNKNTFNKGLIVNGGNIRIDRVAFKNSDNGSLVGITINTLNDCSISNCSFENQYKDKDNKTVPCYAFQVKQDAHGNAPILYLYNNTFSGGCNVELADGSGTVGAWQSTSYSKTEPIDISFGVITDRANSENGSITVYFPWDMNTLTEDGWKFNWNFVTADGYNKAFVVFDGENIESTVSTTNANNNKITFAVDNGGPYTIVQGTLPELVKKDASTKELKFTEAQAKYLNKFTTTCDFKAVKITDKNGKAVKWEKSSDGKLTIWLTGSSPYTIKDDTNVTTKTTTKTTTTSRSYKYTYQDYYLITPQRVTDCMRYAKDNLVTIECKEAGRRSISLPVASMAAAAEKGYSILLKNEKIADITMDAAALKSMAQQAKGTTVLLHYRSLNHKTLTTVGQTSVQSHLNQFPNDNADLAFLVTATSDSETIEDLQQGSITLKIPFIVLPGTEDKENVVYALQGETSADARETTVAEGYLTTKLTDLTEHMVFQIGESVETTEETTEPTVETTVETTQPETEPETVPETTLAPEPEKEEKGFPVWIPIVAVLLLAGGGAAAWFLYFRKRFKK